MEAGVSLGHGSEGPGRFLPNPTKLYEIRKAVIVEKRVHQISLDFE